jgi:hypothetical protein
MKRAVELVADAIENGARRDGEPCLDGRYLCLAFATEESLRSWALERARNAVQALLGEYTLTETNE